MLSHLALLAVASVVLKAPVSKPVNLKCENLPHPNCVDSVAPRLSWQTDTATPNWRQTAYRIVVSSTEKGEGDLWDSGKVSLAVSHNIAYRGKPLDSNEKCFWKVQTWDEGGNTSDWSKPGVWEMGLLKTEDWGASEWIGYGEAGPAPYLRRVATFRTGIKRARLFASGLGYQDIHINGHSISNERDPGYTNFSKRVLYLAHDVTKLVKAGQNCVGAVLGTGWFDVHDIATWHFERADWRARPKLRLILWLEYKDGSVEKLVSDNSWKATTGPIRTDGIYTGETYDARYEMPGWDTPVFNDASWKAAKVLGDAKGPLVALSCPPITISESIKPVSIKRPRPGVYVVDFGQNISGHVQLKLEEPAGTTVRMRYSERVDKSGMVQRSEIETFMEKTKPPQPFQTDTYICSGKGTETWEQKFSYSGFRYMEVTGLTKEPTSDNFRARFAHTDLKQAGSFECSNELLNKIQHATRYAYLSNAQSIFTDCPQREKNGWTGDAHLAAEAGLMNFDSVSLYEKWLDDLADEQALDGSTAVIVPTWGWGRGNSHPAWDSAYPIIVNDLYRYTGDRTMVEKHYDRLKRYVEHLASQTKDGVIPYDSLGDWLPWKTETPSQVTSTAFLYLDSTILANFARILSHDEDAAKFDAIAEATKKAFNDTYWDAQKGVYSNGSQAALSTAIFFGLVPEDRKVRTFNALADDVERQGHIDTGIIGAKNVLRVLSEGGRTDLAYKIVARKEIPGWGYWMEQGATTLWEDWKGESSLNHIMFGDVSNWFIQWLGGIGLDPSSPGFRHILIRPQVVGDLTWVRAEHDSPYGTISSSWTRKGSALKLTVVVPANCSATVALPDGTSREVGSGKYEFAASLPNEAIR